MTMAHGAMATNNIVTYSLSSLNHPSVIHYIDWSGAS